MVEPTPGETDDEPKEENYQNLIVLIAVEDYILNQAKNIKEVAKKWGLSFSAVQRAMSRKQEYSVGGRQYAKRKKAAEKQEDPAKKSKQIKEKSMTKPAEDRSPQPAKPSQDSSDRKELPDIPWVHT